ncbi:hypothetical protein BDW74DRAFT_154330 [Aspergillus multicolor]|uniref:uncharacterized protein n=1 Tax=Aspergillus multicolor TaxID=41759 RepID=UPI003CCD9A97
MFIRAMSVMWRMNTGRGFLRSLRCSDKEFRTTRRSNTASETLDMNSSAVDRRRRSLIRPLLSYAPMMFIVMWRSY